MKNERDVHVLILVRVEERKDNSPDIRSRSATQAYRENFDACFGKKQESNTLN